MARKITRKNLDNKRSGLRSCPRFAVSGARVCGLHTAHQLLGKNGRAVFKTLKHDNHVEGGSLDLSD